MRGLILRLVYDFNEAIVDEIKGLIIGEKIHKKVTLFVQFYTE